MTPLTRVHAAIVKACPEIIELNPNQDANGGYEPEWNPRPITLADVLRAIDESHVDVSLEFGDWGSCEILMSYENIHTGIHSGVWNLKMDSLDAQSPETLKFLCSILCV